MKRFQGWICLFGMRFLRVFLADMRVFLAEMRVICAQGRGIWEGFRERARGAAKGLNFYINAVVDNI